MPLPVTALYAGLLGLWLLTLTARVILMRRGAQVSLGDGGDKLLQRRIRAHGNFTEYVPLCLLLLALLELQELGALWLHIFGLMLLVGRLLHGYALGFTGHSPLRVPGTVLTLFALGGLSLVNVVLAIGS